jgi:hypothetical protein
LLPRSGLERSDFVAMAQMRSAVRGAMSDFGNKAENIYSMSISHFDPPRHDAGD